MLSQTLILLIEMKVWKNFSSESNMFSIVLLTWLYKNLKKHRMSIFLLWICFKVGPYNISLWFID